MYIPKRCLHLGVLNCVLPNWLSLQLFFFRRHRGRSVAGPCPVCGRPWPPRSHCLGSTLASSD